MALSARAKYRRNEYMWMARRARAEFDAAINAGFIVSGRSPRYYVMRARTVQLEVLFELAWARENGRAVA